MQTQPVSERGSRVGHPRLLDPGATFVDLQLNQLLSGLSNRTKYAYNGDRELLTGIQSTIGTETIQTLTYSRYANGLIFRRTTPEGEKEHFYDALNRLGSITDTGNGNITAYGYDPLGNLTAQGSRATTYRTDRPHLVDRVAGANQYDHDLNGNVTHRAGPDIPGGTQDLDYTPFDLPKRVVTAQDTAQERTTYFEYTADTERLVRRDALETRYFVTGLYQRVVDTGTTTTREERFLLYAGDRLLGEIVRKNGSDETLYFHQDALGSVELISNDAGETFSQTFDAFGALTSSAVTRSGYTGHQHETDLGLIDMRGRMYDPLAGRFMSSDPIRQAPFWSQGLNPYSYVFNDPINLTDPSGYASEWLSDLGKGLSSLWLPGAMAVSGGGLGFGLAAGLGGGFGVSIARASAGGYQLPGTDGSATTLSPGTVQEGPGTFSQAVNHQGAQCGVPGAPTCGSGPFGKSPMDKLILEFLNRTSPDPVLSGMTIGESIVAPAAPEHAAHIIRTPSGGYRLGDTMTSGADWGTVRVPRPKLAPGEQHVGMIHTHPGAPTDPLAQSQMDIATANRWARGGSFGSSYVVGPSGRGPYFGVILYQPSPAPGSLTTLLPVP